MMKATADDENPCPGYLFQDIGSYGQCLLEYLLERLQVESCHVKIKVLKIFVHLCGHGSNHFLTELRRNSTFIQQASVYSGPPDPIHGTALYQKVRNTAQEVARLLFTDTISTSVSPPNLAPPTMGMGSATTHRSGMQGFGYSPGKQATGGDSLLDKIQKAAEVVASAVLPPTEHQGIRLHDNYYRAVAAPSAPIEVADMAANGKSATGSQSGASRESSGDLSERGEALQLGDCGQEVALISRLTEGSKAFLSREESQHFIKECSILNCEVVVELLSSKLQDPSNTVQMRALCAVSCLMTSDLLSLEQMFAATQRRLRQLSEGPPGPVANKATKILRQFEALMEAGSSEQQPSGNISRLPAATYLDPLLPTQSATNATTTLHQLDISPTGVTPPPNHPSSPSSLEVQIDSSVELMNDDEEEKLPPVLTESMQNQVEPNRTAEVQSVAEEPELHTDSFSSAEPQSEQPCLSRLSLFSGMQLVTKATPLCKRQTFQNEMDTMDDSLKENQALQNGSKTSDDTALICTSVACDSSQPAAEVRLPQDSVDAVVGDTAAVAMETLLQGATGVFWLRAEGALGDAAVVN
ncbi:hypothetical protein F7725_014077 [Dissostichus mawsoni]|uniref:ENTH domain-containing protein n=1 Tax=Dissostichus mawsoni TaxID=36200 RepID=A0A7J5YXE7_DISMA|nr:hypothetical protein F7725_014077 [Dissostichus mawsoni]